MTDHETLCAEAKGLIGGVPHLIANLANLSALLYGTLDEVNWAGFYLMEGDRLVLGPFQGKPACIEIPIGRGVCGTAVLTGSTQRVEDVHAFPGHIACDAASRSELVVPIRKDGRVVAVLDLDSAQPARFTPDDARGMEQLVRVIESELHDLF